MGLIKILIFIVLIVVAVAFFMPDTFADIKDKLFRKAEDVDITTGNGSVTVSYQEEIPIVEDGATDEEIQEATEAPEESIENDFEDLEEEIVCLKANSGYPDYVGTSRDGDSCADVPVNNDYECISNPPENYDGYINLLTKNSIPKIGCCLTDGKCHWN